MTVFQNEMEKENHVLVLVLKILKNPLQPGHWVMSCALLPPGNQFKSPLHQRRENIVSILIAVQCSMQNG